MGVEPPYIYQRPSTYAFTEQTGKGFRPKSMTQASWTPRDPRPKQEGPLLDAQDFNRHPDSYFVVPYGNLDWKPMSKNTKTKVKWIRGFQLLLRVCALLGALGLLFCVICIRPIGTSLDWIIRVAPALGILHTVYAVYHLSRGCKDRTPASTASYMIFASVMDAGLLPFLAFSAMMAYEEHVEDPSAKDHWQTLFGHDMQTSTIIYSTYLISVTNGALHLTSFLISVYLAVLFRQISKLPPDMNPLEDNLTSRNKAHKRNKSSMSVTTNATSNRSSAQPLMDDARKVPFLHTREASTDTLTPPSAQHHSPTSNRNSQTNFHNISYDGSPRASRTDFHAPSYPTSFSGSPVWTGPPSARSSHTDIRRSPDRAAKRASGLGTSFGGSANGSNPSLARGGPVPATAGHAKRNSLYHAVPAEHNWLGSPRTAGDDNDHSGLQPPELQHLRGSRKHTPELVMSPEVRLPKPQKAGYEFMDERSESRSHAAAATAGKASRSGIRPPDFENRSPKPLGMHPPSPANRAYTPAYTPAPTAAERGNPYRMDERERRVLGAVSGNTGAHADGASALYPAELLSSQNARAGTPASYRRNDGSDYLEVGEDDNPAAGNESGKGKFYGSLRGMIGGRRKGGRAVSTGLDKGLTVTKGLRGREVSGKVAEEGRA